VLTDMFHVPCSFCVLCCALCFSVVWYTLWCAHSTLESRREYLTVDLFSEAFLSSDLALGSVRVPIIEYEPDTLHDVWMALTPPRARAASGGGAEKAPQQVTPITGELRLRFMYRLRTEDRYFTTHHHLNDDIRCHRPTHAYSSASRTLLCVFCVAVTSCTARSCTVRTTGSCAQWWRPISCSSQPSSPNWVEPRRRAAKQALWAPNTGCS
jgi:hypothetical protein